MLLFKLYTKKEEINFARMRISIDFKYSDTNS